MQEDAGLGGDDIDSASGATEMPGCCEGEEDGVVYSQIRNGSEEERSDEDSVRTRYHQKQTG